MALTGSSHKDIGIEASNAQAGAGASGAFLGTGRARIPARRDVEPRHTTAAGSHQVEGVESTGQAGGSGGGAGRAGGVADTGGAGESGAEGTGEAGGGVAGGAG